MDQQLIIFIYLTGLCSLHLIQTPTDGAPAKVKMDSNSIVSPQTSNGGLPMNDTSKGMTNTSNPMNSTTNGELPMNHTSGETTNTSNPMSSTTNNSMITNTNSPMTSTTNNPMTPTTNNPTTTTTGNLTNTTTGNTEFSTITTKANANPPPSISTNITTGGIPSHQNPTSLNDYVYDDYLANENEPNVIQTGPAQSTTLLTSTAGPEIVIEIVPQESNSAPDYYTAIESSNYPARGQNHENDYGDSYPEYNGLQPIRGEVEQIQDNKEVEMVEYA